VNSSSSTGSTSKGMSPLELLLEHLYEQYPPLRYIQNKYHTREDVMRHNNNNKIDDDDDMWSSLESNSPPDLGTGLGENDFRQIYHPMLRKHSKSVAVSTEGDTEFNGTPAIQTSNNVLSGDMDLIFVGTASCTPSVTRGVSCTALRLHMMSNKRRAPGTWLFDCGESTQLQVQRTSSVKPSKITKIFLTHAHGDHSFGLPGLLCLMGQDRAVASGDNGPKKNQNFQPKIIDIYGPEGLRMWLRVAIRYSVSRIVPPYRVHELKDIPMAPEWSFSRKHQRYFYRRGEDYEGVWGVSSQSHNSNDAASWLSSYHRMDLKPSSYYGEVDGGRDIFPHYNHPFSSDGAPVWEVEEDGDTKVYAAPMSHGIPCVGYVVQEADRPGRLRDELVRPICMRNVAALKAAGLTHPLKAMAIIKDMPVGSSFTFPDGTVITQEEAVEPRRPGRKVVICGDTASARALEKLAKGADVVVHEATNAYLYGLDKTGDLRSVGRDAMLHGHSTPQIAGTFAKKVGAKRLILNHFSARYRGDPSMESISVMTRIERQAMKASGLQVDKVAAAWDFMIFPIPLGYNVDDDDSGDDVNSDNAWG